MSQVSFKNVSKDYPRAKGQNSGALRDFSLEVGDREFVVLLGPAGAGKSTLLRLIAGLENASSGDIFIGARRVNDLAPKDRDVAMVFQEEALYPHLSVFDNLAFGLKLRKYPAAEIKKRIADAARILRIGSVLETKPRALTGDQRERVAIGRAIVRQPKVFLFDDPLSRLEAKLRNPLRLEIAQLHERLQTTLIYATSDPIEAMTMADRLIVLSESVVQQDGPPLALYQEPANLFVAGFLGEMNLIDGTLKAEGDKIRFKESAGGTIEVAFAEAERPGAREFLGQPILLGIRPEDLEVSAASRQEVRASGTAFPAILESVEPRGAETYLTLQTGAHSLLCRSRRAIDRREAGHRSQGEINLGKAHFFDPVSKRRIA